MIRYTVIFFASVLPGMAPLPLSQAASPVPEGTWKVMLPTRPGDYQPLWLLKLESREGKWTGSVLASFERFPRTTLTSAHLAGGVLRFQMRMDGQKVTFEGKARGEGNKIYGIITLGRKLYPGYLQRSKLKNLDSIAVLQETLAQTRDPLKTVDTAMALLRAADRTKATPSEVRRWSSRIVESAREFGPDWERRMLLRIVATLSSNEKYAPIALKYARDAEGLLNEKASPRVHKEVLEALVQALEAAKKKDEARTVHARIGKIDFTIKPTPYSGRQGKSDRVVLVELFTGAQCAPCLASDLAFDALGRSYKRSEVVVLQYHINNPSPDPLTTPASEARLSFYGRAVDSTPSVFFNGRKSNIGGGGKEVALDLYDDYCDFINPLLEKPARARITLQANRKDNKIDIKAEVSELEETGNDVRLRLVLVEKQINYKGRNQLKKHNQVVLAFAGGEEGTVLDDKKCSKEVTLDLEEIRKKWQSARDREAKKAPYFGDVPPLKFENLQVVAFVQNNETGEVLQARCVEVQTKQEDKK